MDTKWKVSVDEEMEKNPKLQIGDLTAVQSWMQKQSHLPKISDNQVVLFLHASGYRFETAKKLIENYYTMRTNFKHYFAQRDPLDTGINQAISVAPCVIYGNDKHNRRILWSKLLDYDSSLYSPTLVTKLMFMTLDVDQLENGTVPGYTMVMDGKGFGFNHAMRCSFSNARQVIAYVQSASTVIIEKIFMLNMTPATDKIMYILKPFIRSELLNKITICTQNDDSKLHEMISEDSIPEDYNGKAPSIKELTEVCREKLCEYREWFLKEENLRISETKNNKANEYAVSEEMKFGIDGSFKALAID